MLSRECWPEWGPGGPPQPVRAYFDIKLLDYWAGVEGKSRTPARRVLKFTSAHRRGTREIHRPLTTPILYSACCFVPIVAEESARC